MRIVLGVAIWMCHGTGDWSDRLRIVSGEVLVEAAIGVGSKLVANRRARITVPVLGCGWKRRPAGGRSRSTTAEGLSGLNVTQLTLVVVVPLVACSTEGALAAGATGVG